MSEWQPIETAPKDGTRVLISDGAEIQTAQFTNWRWIASPTGWEGDGDTGGLLTAEFDPTHWMALPAVPKR